ncbi:hypothetical protein GGF41_008015 [Coemansia sp. RSA 2531]|nr:hypothetical protein GGF41_008015 [Coemansia sp. RSA 2531]
MSMAVKLSSITYENGETRDIMKFPKEGSEKVSLPGRFAVYADPENGVPVAFHSVEAHPGENLLRVVYDGGPVDPGVWDDFATVKQRVNDQWGRFPRHAQAVSDSLLAYQKQVHAKQEQSVSEGTAFGV